MPCSKIIGHTILSLFVKSTMFSSLLNYSASIYATIAAKSNKKRKKPSLALKSSYNRNSFSDIKSSQEIFILWFKDSFDGKTQQNDTNYFWRNGRRNSLLLAILKERKLPLRATKNRTPGQRQSTSNLEL